MQSSLSLRNLPYLYEDPAESRLLTLRDGTTAQVRIAVPEDLDSLMDFVSRLSPESLRQRFLSLSVPAPEQIAILCKNTDPRMGVTLIVTRIHSDAAHIIATGSYQAKNASSAEVAFAVSDAFQGKGLGSLLLERLALLAVRHGFTVFWRLPALTIWPCTMFSGTPASSLKNDRNTVRLK